MRISRAVVGVFGPVVLFRAVVAGASQATVPPPFHGDWVPQKAACESAPARLRVAAGSLTLINGKDTHTYGGLGVPTSYFGPDYQGISVVAIRYSRRPRHRRRGFLSTTCR